MRHARRTAILATAAVLLALSGCASEGNADAEANPVADATEAATQSAEPSTAGESIEIPAGLTPEAYGEAFIEKAMTEWTMAGANEENELEWVTAEDSDKYLDDLAQDNADSYASALFVSNWQDDPQLANFVESTKKNNRIALELFFKTFRTDEVPYEYSATANSTAVDGATNSYVTNLTVYNNGAQNRAGELLPAILTQNDVSAVFTYSTEVIDGKEKVAKLASAAAD